MSESEDIGIPQVQIDLGGLLVRVIVDAAEDVLQAISLSDTSEIVDLRLARMWIEEMDEPKAASFPCVKTLEGVMVKAGIAGPGRVNVWAEMLAESFGPDLAVTLAVVAGIECIVVHSGCVGVPTLRLADGLVVKGTTLITPVDGRSNRRMTKRLMNGLVARRTKVGVMWTVAE